VLAGVADVANFKLNLLDGVWLKQKQSLRCTFS